MKRLIYCSIASEEVDFNSVGGILTQAVAKNNEKGITGMLVYDGEKFLQCIEGDKNEIDELYQKLTNDFRHHTLHLIGEELDERRLFTQWNMGYLNNEKEIKKMMQTVTGHEDFSPEILSYPHAKLILLQLSFLL